ncbi:esterase-like activity of phytase family protein [Spartinivicinus poritis]|uniref:Esterase-like activity of phytase family protein n=1 Tax=Spartinivicinus poritis TaxID=2994640 RepID=A0ABT5U5R0_9GAMM|nr:esterase-like activity of phytase family protein [Spartinivicinus sp. A2-2]MDE1461696.1 esterase-like activity of phytase family protein [Spartinivicinus sp. A2-2]
MTYLKYSTLVLSTALGLVACQQPTHFTANAETNTQTSPITQPTLVGFAKLPADSFADGLVSGGRLGSNNINGQQLPFKKQPVQGFSAVLKEKDGRLLALSDNGYGTLETSADYLLRLYTLKPDYKTQTGKGSGKVKVEGFISLKDPNKQVPFAIVNQFTEERLLTGADFDVESVQRAPDGSLWIGDEFGPFLLHFDKDGILLEPPYRLPNFASDLTNKAKYLNSPQNPYLEEGSAVRVMNAVAQHAKQQGAQFRPVFSPYHVMLQDNNPKVTHYARDKDTPEELKLAASGVFDVSSVQKAGYPVVTWTVNDKPRMLELMKLEVDGIISDRPDLLLQAVQEFDANNDGKPGDFLTREGLIDSSKFDAQGHRGGRNLRPENTLPAMEVALDNLMTTLETDTGITKDGQLMLNHDPYIEAGKCRRKDGSAYTEDNQALIKDLTAKQIQQQFICDKTFRGDSQQSNPALSPVTEAFVKVQHLPSVYVMPTLQQLFDFVTFYQDYYTSGPGKYHPKAVKRRKVAATARFNIETKINPRSDKDKHGNVYKDRTVDAKTFASKLAQLIKTNNLVEQVDIQSFDFNTLLEVQKNYPGIRTVYLIGDFPTIGPDADDGTNLQDENGKNTPWLAGLYWPYRNTALVDGISIKRSGGFEGLAISKDGKRLLAMLELPVLSQNNKKLANSKNRNLIISEFDLLTKQFTGKQYYYPMDKQGTAIGAFKMINNNQGLVVERDGSQGDLNGYKKVHLITLKANGQVEKQELVDLLTIADPHNLAMGETGDVGIGNNQFAFPFETIENIVILDKNHIALLNDNNYPFSIGRHVTTNKPDDNEIIVIRLPEGLKE